MPVRIGNAAVVKCLEPKTAHGHRGVVQKLFSKVRPTVSGRHQRAGVAGNTGGDRICTFPLPRYIGRERESGRFHISISAFK